MEILESGLTQVLGLAGMFEGAVAAGIVSFFKAESEKTHFLN